MQNVPLLIDPDCVNFSLPLQKKGGRSTPVNGVRRNPYDCLKFSKTPGQTSRKKHPTADYGKLTD